MQERLLSEILADPTIPQANKLVMRDMADRMRQINGLREDWDPLLLVPETKD